MAQSLLEKSKRTSDILLQVGPCGNLGDLRSFHVGAARARLVGEVSDRLSKSFITTLLIMSG
jgi:hypothetical protein